VGLVWHQFRYDQRTFWRDPAAVFFTVALPIVFLLLFVSIFGNDPIEVEGRTLRGATYYVPGIVTLALVSATLVNLSITVTMARERGVLKHLRSTPLPPWVFMAGRIGTAAVVTVLLVVVLLALGRLFYDVTVPTNTVPGVVLSVVVGTASFCALAFALTAVIPSENAAPPITNAIVLPLYFMSGLFVPEDQLPETMRLVAEAFPVKHLFQALLTAFDPTTSGTGIRGGHVAVMAVWGVAGLLAATRLFRWTPRSG
jgi:ABC-2 type transport system permease protein